MAHFAEIDLDNIVTRVLVVDNSLEHRGADFLANDLGLGGNWIQTSYNTQGGVNNRDGRVALHKNYAGIGYSWDGVGFAAPQPYLSWNLDSDTYLWEAPTPMPTDDKHYTWDEETTSWIEVPTL
jgi:hypothetical protein